MGRDPGIIVTITFLKVSFMLTVGAARSFRLQRSDFRMRYHRGSYPDPGTPRYARGGQEGTPLMKPGDSRRYGPLTRAPRDTPSEEVQRLPVRAAGLDDRSWTS